MILNNKVSQRLEIIGFKGAVKKSTSRIQDKLSLPRLSTLLTDNAEYRKRLSLC